MLPFLPATHFLFSVATVAVLSDPFPVVIVTQVILARGGPRLRADFRRLQLRTGESKATPAYKLPCRGQQGVRTMRLARLCS